jgi:hypothetical protein
MKSFEMEHLVVIEEDVGSELNLFFVKSTIVYRDHANRRIPVSHKYPPWGIEPGSHKTGRKRVDHWTSGTVYECSEIAGGSPQQA